MNLENLSERCTGRFQKFAAQTFGRKMRKMINQRPLISFTFDDFPRSALWEGGDILEEHNLRATYYVCLGLLGKQIETGEIAHASDLPRLVAAGHELGCHTYSHEHSWATPTGKFCDAIDRNRQALNELAPDSVFHSFSFPISYPGVRIKRRVTKQFASCRCGGQTFNAGRLDAGLLAAFFLEKVAPDLSLIRDIIARNTRACGWLIFATHDVGVNPTRYGCSSQFFRDVVSMAVDSAATILPVNKAFELAVETDAFAWDSPKLGSSVSSRDTGNRHASVRSLAL